MAVTFKIKFEGVSPGIVEHRLSVGAFARALSYLHKAVRRVADQMASDALDDEMLRAGSRSGTYGRYGKALDLQLESLDEGSLELCLAVVFLYPPEPQQRIPFEGMRIESRAAARIVADLKSESSGTMTNKYVRRYLEALPSGLESQSYSVLVDGEEIASCEVGDVETFRSGPRMGADRFEADVVAVSFDPYQVKLADQYGTKRTYDATAELVEEALEMRGGAIIARVAYFGDRARIVRLDTPEREPAELSWSELQEHAMSEWRGLFERLSQ